MAAAAPARLPAANRIPHLRQLEAEAMHIMREVAAEFERPVLLFSGGKDSIVMLAVAAKAFAPGRIPFPAMHVDTGHNFPEVLRFRDRQVAELGVELVVASVQAEHRRGARGRGDRAAGVAQPPADRDPAGRDPGASLRRGVRRRAARRGEGAGEGARSSPCATTSASGTPRISGPEVWTLYNARHRRGEHMRVFPLSNWTELDIWEYIDAEGLELPPLYFAHEREVFRRDGMLYAVGPHVTLLPNEAPFRARVRYRTVGDMTCTAAVPSDGGDAAGGRARDRGDAHHGARRDARRRSHLGDGHGGPQA